MAQYQETPLCIYPPAAIPIPYRPMAMPTLTRGPAPPQLGVSNGLKAESTTSLKDTSQSKTSCSLKTSGIVTSNQPTFRSEERARPPQLFVPPREIRPIDQRIFLNGDISPRIIQQMPFGTPALMSSQDGRMAVPPSPVYMSLSSSQSLPAPPFGSVPFPYSISSRIGPSHLVNGQVPSLPPPLSLIHI